MRRTAMVALFALAALSPSRVEAQAADGARRVLAQRFMDAGEPDSALALLRAGRSAGEDSVSLGEAALAFGNTLYRAAAGDSATGSRRQGFLKAIAFLALADTLTPSPAIKLLRGVASFQLGLGYVQEAQAAVKGKKPPAACAASRAGIDYFTAAQTSVEQAGTESATYDGRIMRTIRQYAQALERWKQESCRWSATAPPRRAGA